MNLDSRTDHQFGNGYSPDAGADDDLSPEAMEAAHEAAHPGNPNLLGAGVVAAANVQMQVLSPLAEQLQQEIATVCFKSQLKDAHKNLSLALARRRISNDEYDLLFGAFEAKKASLELSKPNIHKEQEWSPSDILATMSTKPHELDWRERQLPTGDRD